MAGPSPELRPEPRRRGFVEVRWRQFRRAPRPVFRAVMSSLVVALVLGGLFIAYDIALDRGASLPGGDLRLLALTLYVVLVCTVGAVATWLLVPLPTGSGMDRRTRTPCVTCSSMPSRRRAMRLAAWLRRSMPGASSTARVSSS